MSELVDMERRFVTEQARQDSRIDSHSMKIRDLEIWRAKVQGFLLALTIFAALPTVMLAYIALQDRIGG